MKRYGITSAELAVADTDAFKAAKAIILKKSDIVANAEEVNGIGLKELVASSTDEIANRMRWQSQFFKDFYANSQRLTNRQLVIDEDDFVWYAGKDGRLSTKQINWKNGEPEELSIKNLIKGNVSFISKDNIKEIPIKKEKLGNKVIVDNKNINIIVKSKDDIFNTEVWAGKDYKNGNVLMTSIIDNEPTVTIKPKKDELLSPTTTPKNEKGDGDYREAYLNSKNKISRNGFESEIKINFDYAGDYIVESSIVNDMIKIKANKEKLGNFIVYGHELIHALHNQLGINDQNRVYYEYLDFKGKKHRTGEKMYYTNFRDSSGNKRTEKEILFEIRDKISKEWVTDKDKEKYYIQAEKELAQEGSEKYDYVMKQIKNSLNNLTSKDKYVEIFVPILLIKQEEFNTVGTPNMTNMNDILQKNPALSKKYPIMPTERGLEEENGFLKRAVYEGEIK